MSSLQSTDTRRRSGLVVPLFSCASSRSWGIGDITDIPCVAAWLHSAGVSVLQLLPVNEMAPGQQSPYSAISAMAIDPIFIGIDDVPEFASPGVEALSAEERDVLEQVRRLSRIDHAAVRRLKRRVLRRCFERFLADEWSSTSPRGRRLKQFIADESWWLGDYALFRALHVREGERPWTEWPDELRTRQRAAIDAANRELANEVLFYQYLQWLAHTQWSAARERSRGIALYGDLPFMVDGDSADVWARQHQFRLDVSIGVPPDAFSATGQDWGMPMYRWDSLAADNYRWLRDRARRSADLYDGYRVDHLVGFFRTYGRPRDGSEPFFSPADEAAQLALGERLLSIFRASGADIIAEDLGTVPDFVRASLDRLGVPGFRVLRWERRWHDPGQPFRDPEAYPAASVAASGTHDTEPLRSWWEHADLDEQAAVDRLDTVRRLTGGAGILGRPFLPLVRDVLIEALFASGSTLLLLPVQDVFGWHDRINEPATVNSDNWTFRLPWPVDRLDDVAEARERRDALRRWSERTARS